MSFTRLLDLHQHHHHQQYLARRAHSACTTALATYLRDNALRLWQQAPWMQLFDSDNATVSLTEYYLVTTASASLDTLATPHPVTVTLDLIHHPHHARAIRTHAGQYADASADRTYLDVQDDRWRAIGILGLPTQCTRALEWCPILQTLRAPDGLGRAHWLPSTHPLYPTYLDDLTVAHSCTYYPLIQE